MKKYILSLMLAGSFTCAALAQGTIHFTAITPDQNCYTDYGKDLIRKKVEQIIARNGAGATSIYNAFVIQPELNILEQKATEGLIQNVTLVKAEFSLTAKNLYDESVYGSVIVNVTGDATGDTEKALKALLSNIKSTNPAFTRFIRTTRDKILQHYNANCPTIIKKAQTMLSMGKIDDAIGYLSSVPEIVPCYEEAATMMTQAAQKAKSLECDQLLLLARSMYIMREYEKALYLLTKITSDSPCNAAARALTDSIAKYTAIPAVAEVPEPAEPAEETVPAAPATPATPAPAPAAPEAAPAAPATPAPAPAPAEPAPAATPVYKLNVSCPDLDFQLISCIGNESSQTITLYCKLTNNGKNEPRAVIRMQSVIDPSGATYDSFTQSTMHGCSDAVYGNNMPTEIAISKCFVIRGVVKKLSSLSYVEIDARNCKVTLRNVPVIWK